MTHSFLAQKGFFFRKNRSILSLFITLISLIVLCSAVNAAETEWEWRSTPDIPQYDEKWRRFEEMWAKHWDGKNIDDMIVLITQLETDYPEKIEPKLWQGKLNVLKGKSKGKAGEKSFKLAEAYAVAANKIDPENKIAFKILIDVLPYIGDIDYAKSVHGAWIKKAAPLKSGHVVPPMTGNAEWEAALALWDQRAGSAIDQITPEGLEGVEKFNQLANNNPKDLLANAWACRVNYDTGQFYTSVGKHEEKGFPHYTLSIQYGEKALAIDPNYLPAKYWSTISQARLIQKKSILHKAKYINFMMENGLFGQREDCLYNYFGHSLALATMITNGGWAAEKGISMAGVEIETLINQLWIAHTVYPTKLYALYGLADLYNYQKNHAKAQEVLDLIFSMDADQDPFITLENRAVVRFAKEIQQDIDSKKKQRHDPM